MSNKNLIYYVSYGDYYHREMVKFSILSILDRTDFIGDIIVLSDEEGIPMDVDFINKRVTVINIYDKFPELRNNIVNRYNIFCIKSMINKVIDITQYNFVLYLDADTLLNFSNLNQLMNFWASCNVIQIANHEGWDISREKPSTGSQFLSREEIIKWKNHGFCAGVLGFPGNQLGIDLLSEWFELNKNGNFELDDQGALTAILLRNYSGRYELNKFCNENRWILKDINHYHSNNKKLFWEHCKILLSKYQVENMISGKWNLNKPIEAIQNIWTFIGGIVFVDNPNITGTLQCTTIGNYVWWQCFEGFEKLKMINNDSIIGDSFKGGEDCFFLSRVKN